MTEARPTTRLVDAGAAVLANGLLMVPGVVFGVRGYLQGMGQEEGFVFNPILDVPLLLIKFCGLVGLVWGVCHIYQRRWWGCFAGLTVMALNWFGPSPEDLYLLAIDRRVPQQNRVAFVREAQGLIDHYNRLHPDAKRPSTDWQHYGVIDEAIDSPVPTPWPPAIEALHSPPGSVWVSSDSVKIRLETGGLFQGLIVSQQPPPIPDCRTLAEGLYWLHADPF